MTQEISQTKKNKKIKKTKKIINKTIGKKRSMGNTTPSKGKKPKFTHTAVSKEGKCCNHQKAMISSEPYRKIFVECVKVCVNTVIRMQNSTTFTAEQWFQDVYLECCKEYQSQCKTHKFEPSNFGTNCSTFKESFVFFIFFYFFFIFLVLFAFFNCEISQKQKKK